MHLSELLGAIEARVPFHLARRLLVENGFPTGQSWVAVREKIGSEEKVDQASVGRLQVGYEETVVATEKLARLYDLKEPALEVISALSSSSMADNSDAGKVFPGLMAREKQQAFLYSQPELIFRNQNDLGFVAIFSSVRAVAFKVPIPQDKLAKELQGLYREVFATSYITTQYFDAVLILRDQNRAVVLTDNPLHMHVEDKLAAQNAARIAFNAAVGSNVLEEPINLYPASEALYRSDDGVVQDLGAMSDTLRETRERMHSGTCIRHDPAHKAERDSGVSKRAFGIEIAWPQEDTHGHSVKPTLLISGHARNSFEVNPVLRDAAIRKCISLSELGLVLTKLQAAI